MCVRREKRSGFNAPALPPVETNLGASTSILRVQGYRCNGRRVMEGAVRTGRISTCDLTRTRYLPPLSLRGRRERFRSFTAEKRSFSLLFHLLLLFFLSVPFFPQEFHRTAVLNETFVSIISARRPPGPPKRDTLAQRLANCSRASAN